MKISAKGRYGLASMTYLAENHGTNAPVTIISISERLGISKIYLEQVFALLKRARLVTSIKGSQGGYQLSRSPKEISAYDILASTELSLIEKTASSVGEKVPEIEKALQILVYAPLDDAIADALRSISLADLLSEMEQQKPTDNLMYFI